MRQLRQVLGIAVPSSKWIVRQPLWLFQSLITAVGFALIMLSWGGVEALKNMAIAWLVAGAWGTGLNLIAQSIGWERIGYEYERLVASPVSLPVYFAGHVLGHVPWLLAVDIGPAILIAWVAGIPPLAVAALLLLTPLALVLGAFTCLAIVLRIKNPTNISAITNPLNTLTVVLPPVYYPLTALPEPLRLPLLAVPTVSLTELARWAVGYRYTCFNPTMPAVMLAAWSVVAVPLALKRMKWGME